MPLYDILNEFQKGSSHMAAVVKVKGKSKNPKPTFDREKLEEETLTNAKSDLTAPLLTKHDDKSGTVFVDIEKAPRPMANNQTIQQNSVTTNGLPHLSEDTEDGEVIGIITLEDVFEELLQVRYFYHFMLSSKLTKFYHTVLLHIHETFCLRFSSC